MQKKLAALAFLLIYELLLWANAFPSLYGDEYDSLFDSRNLSGNIHAIGYFSQLRAWDEINGSNWFLRFLSLLWLGAGLYWLGKWAQKEVSHESTTNFFLWLAVLNPFLWIYGLQIRFYAMFFAASLLFIWRFRAWQKSKSRANAFWLGASMATLFSSHLFGFLAAGTVVLAEIWKKTQHKRWLATALLTALAVLLIPSARGMIVEVVYRATNPYAEVSQQAARGISVGMLAKVPLTFYFFALGERVYPLWWWITVPAMLVVGAAFFVGLWKIRALGELGALSIFMLLNIPLLYLVLDPLAPPTLQGAAPRYLIFVLPYFLILLAHGAEQWQPLKPALILVNLIGLYCLAFPVWSYGGSDLINWKKILSEAIPNPEQTCVVTDGRAQAPVKRYLPNAGKFAFQGSLRDCEGFVSIALVSNHFNLDSTRYFDSMAEALNAGYQLTANIAVFPAHITAYQKSENPQNSVIPSRLDLPEQDLTLPAANQRIQGFSRLDSQRPSLTLQTQTLPDGWILTNYRSDSPLPDGTPVFRLTFENGAEMILRSGMETAAWDGLCPPCADAYQWTKRLHLVGSYSYPGAYRQYPAHVWGVPLPAMSKEIVVEFLPAQGTGYFYGVVPQP